MVMVMHGSTRTSTAQNEIYAVNGIGFAYMDRRSGQARRARAHYSRT
jgi:hypothetical protein